MITEYWRASHLLGMWTRITYALSVLLRPLLDHCLATGHA
jgi:hypothetical protein